jgi:hypothetical protein
MTKPSDIENQKNAIELKKVNKDVIKAICNGDDEFLRNSLARFIVLKKKIKMDLMECPITKIDDIEAVKVLYKIQQQDSFEADKIFDYIQSNSDQPVDYDSLDEDEVKSLQDVLYVWFGPDQYVRSLYEIGTLVANLSVPSSLKEYVSEARQCYAFQQYNAVYSLCRTIIETAIRNKCQRKGIIPRRENVAEFINYHPGELINKATAGSLREKAKEIYQKTSVLLHGRKTVDSCEARKMFQETLKLVQEMEK